MTGKTNALSRIFAYAREHKIESAALLASLTVGADQLLGTSALTPFLANPLVAAGALAASLGLLLQNGKTVVHNTLALGGKWGLSAMTLGLIIGSLNTVPETAVSVSSILNGALAIGTGNVVGSSIAHTLVILGIPALALGIGKSKDLGWKFNAAVMAGSTALFGAQLLMGTFSPVIGAIMLGTGGYYLWNRFCRPESKAEHSHEHEHHHDHDHCDHDHEHEHEHDHHDHDHEEAGSCAFHDHGDDEEIAQARTRPHWLNAVLTGGGILGLMAASNLIVGSGEALAQSFNLSSLGLNFGLGQAAIGAVLVALGTAAPEIAVSLEAVRKKQGDLAIGNILGCSIINTLVAGGILSLTGAAVPEAFSPHTASGLMHTGFFLGATGAVTAALLTTGGAVKRWMGAAALALYATYAASALALGDGETLHKHESAAALEYVEVIPTPSRPAVPVPL